MADKRELLHPSIIKDSSAGTPGVVANEIAAEDDGLISDSVLNSHSYGATGSEEESSANAKEDGGYAVPKSQLLVVVTGLYMGSFLAALDTTVVTTLLTVIASDLNAISNVSWIATAYLLSNAAFQPIFGKLSDIFGRKAVLLLCCGCFAVGCFICVTDSLLLLVLGRFITGIGGSGLTTVGTITLSDLIPLRDRGLYQGIINIFFGLGAASGGILGGLISDNFGWKYVFGLQIPMSLLVALALYYNLNLPKGSQGLGAHGDDWKKKLNRVDFKGSFFLVTSLMAFMAAASMGGKNIAYSSLTFVGLVLGGGILLGGFIYTELYIAEEPIIPVELIAERTVLSSSLANWFYTMGVFSYLFYVPFYFNAVMGLTATQSGLRLVPNFFGIAFGSLGAGYYMKKTGKYYKLTVLVGIVSLAGVTRIYFLGDNPSKFTQFTLILLPGIGYACILTVTLLSLIAATPVKYQACTTSIQYTFRSTGSTLGVSIASAIFQNVLRSSLNKSVRELVSDPKEAGKIIAKALESTNYTRQAPKFVQHAIISSYQLACKGTYLFSICVIALGYISSLFMREHTLHTSMNRD